MASTSAYEYIPSNASENPIVQAFSRHSRLSRDEGQEYTMLDYSPSGLRFEGTLSISPIKGSMWANISFRYAGTSI